MSRVHDALRRAEQSGGQIAPSDEQPAEATAVAAVPAPPAPGETAAASAASRVAAYNLSVPVPTVPGMGIGLDLLRRVRQVPFTPSPDSHLIDVENPHEAPAEEFRSLRTRLNHMQSMQPIHSVVITSASPAEGKSFAAVNLAITESQLEGNNTLLLDCDFRRPIVHTLFGLPRGPGMTDFLQGKAALEDCIYKIGNSNLYIIPAGEPVINPLELLNLREMRATLDQLPRVFNWIILDSPPLLFAADANLLSTMSSGVVLVVRIGTTTIEAVTRAMGSLCEDNTIGIIVNGARRGELYSKYTYYHSYYYASPDDPTEAEALAEGGSKEHERELD
ncbi:MAG: CpsD/CapB family tyrosine-protein kinase [Bryobacteraceae bacterium]|nr:CpsD/CapB family tyrosine-protein kinase [Bryobacteraceae bacterium]